MKMLINGVEYKQVDSGSASVLVMWELRDETRRLGEPFGLRKLVALERQVERAHRELKEARASGDDDAVISAQGDLLDATDEILPVSIYLTRRMAGDKGPFLELIDVQVEYVREDGDEEIDAEVDATDPTMPGPDTPGTPVGDQPAPVPRKKSNRRSTTSAHPSTSG